MKQKTHKTGHGVTRPLCKLQLQLNEIVKLLPEKVRTEEIPPPNNEVDATLDYIRLTVSYLSFNQEALERENQYLRDILEELEED